MTTSGDEDDRSRSASPDEQSGEEDGGEMAEHSDGKDGAGAPKGSKPLGAKDPLRPRRKKARRACYACQRAHLTCGDERPCQRCIKRGLQDACQDGVRKKAKYLHDAPNEALMPGVGGNLFHHGTPLRTGSTIPSSSDQSPNQPNPFFPTPQPFNNFSVSQQMPPPALQESRSNSLPFGQPGALDPPYRVGSQSGLSNPALTHTSGHPVPTLTPHWNGGMFDPGDPGLFNFDLASMNFGNHYGALEFGMLGHLATGAGDTPPSDTTTQRGSVGHPPFPTPMASFSGSPNGQPPFLYNDNVMSEWPGSATLYNQPYYGTDGPHAFAIESNHVTFHSPDADSSPAGTLKFEDSPTTTASPFNKPSATSNPLGGPKHGLDAHVVSPPRRPTHISTPQLKAKSQLPVKHSKAARNPSTIYTDVTSPYSYTTGFHSLIAYLQRRFAASPARTLTIAKSLASIRPSFIATTKTLNRDDLIFMEKCFQRTLFEYEGFIEGVGTPTIVARRTGEIAAVGKEFQILTGWKRDVLLGRAPNLNVNGGGDSTTHSGANTTGRATGVTTPVPRPLAMADTGSGDKRLQPVFLAELLDDESVVHFYEDFARLAFGDSRGSVMGKGKLLKYRSKDDEIAHNLQREAESREEGRGATTLVRPPARQPSDLGIGQPGSALQKELKKEGIAGEKGMQKLGSRDGKVECTYCWTVKRDVFDIPMLIVMNFLPCI